MLEHSLYLGDKMVRGVGGGEKNCQQVQVSRRGLRQKHLKRRRSELKTKRAWIEYWWLEGEKIPKFFWWLFGGVRPKRVVLWKKLLFANLAKLMLRVPGKNNSNRVGRKVPSEQWKLRREDIISKIFFQADPFMLKYVTRVCAHTASWQILPPPPPLWKCTSKSVGTHLRQVSSPN